MEDAPSLLNVKSLPGVRRVVRLSSRSALAWLDDGRIAHLSLDGDGRLWVDTRQTGAPTIRHGPLPGSAGRRLGAQIQGPAGLPVAQDVAHAPTAGTVLRLLVQLGDVVESGSPLLIIELMKMELQVVAPRAGSVAALYVAAGEAISRGQPLVRVT